MTGRPRPQDATAKMRWYASFRDGDGLPILALQCGADAEVCDNMRRAFTYAGGCYTYAGVKSLDEIPEVGSVLLHGDRILCIDLVFPDTSGARMLPSGPDDNEAVGRPEGGMPDGWSQRAAGNGVLLVLMPAKIDTVKADPMSAVAIRVGVSLLDTSDLDNPDLRPVEGHDLD